VDVVVDVLLDLLATVNNLAVQRSLSVSVGVLASDRSKQGSVLVSRGVLLLNAGDGVDLLVHLLGTVLRVEDWLSVVLNVVDVTVVLLLASHLLNLVALVSAVLDGSKVLNILVNLTVVEVEVLVHRHIVALLVSDGAVLGVNVGRSTQTGVNLVGDLLTDRLVLSSTGGGRTSGSELLGVSLGRTRVRGGGGRRREATVVRRVVVGMRLARESLLDRVHVGRVLLLIEGLKRVFVGVQERCYLLDKEENC